MPHPKTLASNRKPKPEVSLALKIVAPLPPSAAVLLTTVFAINNLGAKISARCDRMFVVTKLVLTVSHLHVVEL